MSAPTPPDSPASPLPPPAAPPSVVSASAPPESSRAVGVRCANCGAAMVWEPDGDALACAHCGARRALAPDAQSIVERPLEEAGTAARGLGLETRSARCTRCGATTSFAGQDVATSCAFCGAAAVLVESSWRNALRPESLIPLDVSRAQVEAAFRKWASRLWFRPSALRKARIDAARGLYVPAWTFDCRAQSAWAADAGFYYTVMEPRPVMMRGKLTVRVVPVQKVRWEPAAGRRDDRYDDVLVHASRALPSELATELGKYDTRALVAYRPEYLAGWAAEEYALDLEQGWKVGLARIEQSQRSRCTGDVPGDTQRNLRVRNALSEVRWKLVLLPVWSLTYRHGGRDWSVLVHGQSGRAVGRAPWSWVKLAFLGLGIAIAVLVAMALLAL